MSARRCIGLLALALTACGGQGDDLDVFITEVKSRTSKAIEPLPQIKQYQSFSYVAGSRRDPFEQDLTSRAQREAAAGGMHPDFNRNREPLEEFPLDSLRMVGTIKIRDKTFGLVKAPDGVIHRVASGDHMGQNYGEVKQITEAEIQLSEYVPDTISGWAKRPAVLGLAE